MRFRIPHLLLFCTALTPAWHAHALAEPAPAPAPVQSCDEQVKAASARLVFTADNKRYFLGRSVDKAEAVDPLKACAQSRLAPIEKKLCFNSFTGFRTHANAYLKELESSCRTLRSMPPCARADAACAARVSARAKAAQEKLLGMLGKLDPKRIDQALPGVERGLKAYHENLFKLLQQADRENKLAAMKAKAAHPLPPPARGNLDARQVGRMSLEQAWTVLAGQPLPSKASTITHPEGALVKEMKLLKAATEHLKKNFLEQERTARGSSLEQLTGHVATLQERTQNSSTLTGATNAPGIQPPGRGSPGDPGLGQIGNLAQSALAQAASAMKGQPGGGQQGTQPTTAVKPFQPPGTSTTGTTPPGATTAPRGSSYYGSEVAVLSNTGNAVLTTLAENASNPLNGTTGAIRRGNGSGAGGSGARATGGAAGHGGGTGGLDSAVKDAILASRSGAVTGAGGTEGAGPAARPTEEGLSFAALKARFNAAVDSFNQVMDPASSKGIGDFFGASGSGSGGGGGPVASSAPRTEVAPIDSAPVTRPSRAGRAPASLPPVPEKDGEDFVPSASRIEQALLDGATDTLAADVKVTELSLFERVRAKLNEKAGTNL